MEIERKFRLKRLPLVCREGVFIAQGYLFTDGGELRVRVRGDHFYLTIKGEGSISRNEWEVEIPRWVFDTLWPKTEGRRVEKTRYTIPYNGLMLEVDNYLRDLIGLIVLECEFRDEEAAEEFKLPEWIQGALDVTSEPAYKNKNLAVHGMPS